MFLKKFLEKFMFLLPPTCIFCGSLSRQPYNICIPCQQTLPILSHHCPQCAQIQPASIVCRPCLTNPPPFNRTYALFPYQPPIIRIITALKFQHKLSHAKLLGTLLALKIKDEWYLNKSLPDVIIPIPLHPLRLKERGFNQSLEIARPISQFLNIPIDARGSIRLKHTLAQSGLSAADRKLNMINAFAIDHDYTGLSIAVIDDVITTHHTMSTFCHSLRQAGALKIDAWCCARAIVDIAPRRKTR